MGKQMLCWPQSRKSIVTWASPVSVDPIEVAFPYASDNVFPSKAEIVCYMELLDKRNAIAKWRTIEAKQEYELSSLPP